MEVPKPVREKKKRTRGLSPTKRLKKECDSLWAKIVRSKSSTCIWCRKRAVVNAHHIISRRFLPTRYATLNGAALCGGCHMMAHQRPDRFIPFIKKHLGEATYEKLCITADLRKTRPDYAMIILSLGIELEEISMKDKAASYEMGGVG